ncbi:MAG TPA: hypothetical protein O0X97_04170 [Methanocorpusculum sp.]|nr:hypothetical protein [Methanocorpusculum sp.]
MDSAVPIIFIPGILSSQLYLPENGKKIWLSPLFLKMPERMEISSPLTVKNNETDQQTLPGAKREKGMMMKELHLIEKLCSTFPERPVYYFSYDWRSCRKPVRKLLELTDYLKKQGYEKADVICHSMGGLVLSSYVARNGLEFFRKIICLAVPFEGSPLIEKLAVTGDIHSIPNSVAETFKLSKEMLVEYPSAADLLPSAEYLSVYPIYRKGIPMTPEETESFLGELMPKTFSAGRKFQRSLHRNAYKQLLDYPDCCFGIGVGKETTQTISLEDDGEIEEYTDASGDRDVPEYSSTMCGRVEKLGFKRFRRFDARHSELLRAGEPMDWILELLGADEEKRRGSEKKEIKKEESSREQSKTSGQ